mgnify:CR=1 FL=1
MTFTGVNLGEDGKPNRWKVENSWGKDAGKDGYYVMSDAWFDRYVTELIIRKEYLDDATRACSPPNQSSSIPGSPSPVAAADIFRLLAAAEVLLCADSSQSEQNIGAL